MSAPIKIDYSNINYFFTPSNLQQSIFFYFFYSNNIKEFDNYFTITIAGLIIINVVFDLHVNLK